MAGPAQRFALELRKLRQEAGSPTYRVMAQGAGYSSVALSRAAAGETLPSLNLTLAYVRACGADPAEWERRWNAVHEEDAVHQQQALDAEATDPPYRGLARFEPGDHARFFGRARLTDTLTALASSHRCVMVLGPSGSGKSSLLRAGLVPRLRDTADPALRPAAIRILTPGPRPAHEHRERFTPAEGRGDTWLIVDQFEEVFTLCQDPGERRAFIGLLLSAQDPDSGLRVVVGLRADFYARCLEHAGLAAVLGEASLPVGPMTPDELREAIVKPAAAEGLIVERALTARLIEAAGQEPGGLPLVSHTLLETWRRRRGRTLTLEGYEATGGIHGAIAQTAEHFYSRLAPPHAEAARRILLRLITPGEGTTPDTRRPVDRAELATTGAGPRAAADPDTVLYRLADARLVTLDGDTAELAHEALITAWPRLLGWIEGDRERLRRHRRLTDAARNWHDRARDTGALLRGVELIEARESFHAPGQPGELTALEEEFLQQSVRAEARRSRRRRQFMAALGVLLVLALTATAIAVRKTTAAETQQRLAVSREQAVRADQMTERRPEAAMVLALRAYRQAPTAEARSSLLNAYSRFYANQLTGHSSPVSSLAFAPDGQTLATASADHSVKLWDVRSHGLLATLTGHTEMVNTVAFSPDGHTLATASNDRSVKLWDARSHRLLATLTGHTDMAEGVAFSPDGRTLASSSGDRTVRLWDVRTYRGRAVLTGHTDRVARLAFSPDGRMLASADTGRTTRLWDVSSHQPIAVLTDRTGAVRTVAFSPDGRTLATTGNLNGVRLWDVRSHRLLATLSGHTDVVQQVTFSPDGGMLASASFDGTVRLWQPRNRVLLTTLSAGKPAYAVAFSPDGRTLASTGKDSTVCLWDVASRRLVATLSGRSGTVTEQTSFADRRAVLTVDHDNAVARWSPVVPRTRPAPLHLPRPVTASVTSSDGRVLATAGPDDRAVRVWNLATGRLTATLSGATGTVQRLSITADGQTLAAADSDRTIRVWDVATRRTTTVVRGSRAVNALALRPDGRALASTSADGITRVRSTGSGRAVTSLSGPQNPWGSLTFSPDGRTIAVSGNDGAVQLWDVAARRVTAVLTGHTRVVSGMMFSPDGSTLATASNDQSVRLWDSRDGSVRAILKMSHEVDTQTLRFSPDGQALTLFGPRAALNVWSTDSDHITTRLCRLVAEHHWAQLLLDQPVRGLCPA
ncbi:hypothetical protein [Streptomyces monomycini]|uniref:nSTAND1 domain-containing NTPase n=1 Tax=Streptomyces monomycini TaxID=371720 RepID=UPI0009986922|nr:hypothetical protein [Streptomyces monomycini]